MNRKQLTIILAVVLVVAVAAAAFIWRSRSKNEAGSQTAEVEKAKDIYYCPMHPTVVSDHPGNCPICGMTLVKREPVQTSPAAAELAGSGAVDPSVAAVALSPEQRVTANVRALRIEPATHTGDLLTSGRVTFDERRLAQVTAYTAGRVEQLFVNFTGDTVRRGQSVATIYSPDLFATQQEYLLALSNRERMRRAGFADARSSSQDLVDSTRRRLQLFGMTSGQIQQLERTGKPLYTTSIISPVSGIVIRKNVVPQQYVALGQALFDVADLSIVWVEADVYEQQLPDIKLGQRVSISSPSFPGSDFPGTVSFIQPVLAGETRTARVRIELRNPQLRLKPDMFVSVRIFGAPAPAHIMVPKSAVIDRGQMQFVWVESTPGTYQPREVKTGPRHGDDMVILSGVNAGDVVVIEGGFLLDSEAQLRGATAGAAAQHQGH